MRECRVTLKFQASPCRRAGRRRVVLSSVMPSPRDRASSSTAARLDRGARVRRVATVASPSIEVPRRSRGAPFFYGRSFFHRRLGRSKYAIARPRMIRHGSRHRRDRASPRPRSDPCVRVASRSARPRAPVGVRRRAVARRSMARDAALGVAAERRRRRPSSRARAGVARGARREDDAER